ncbi:hypothetical protein ruthe_00440 [Rubellimicrobium thermophilum DSM 16684]|jgi:predicted small secreted protein|uniref:Flp pilus assembly protein, pilin Flp n=1 Tax=Rubellimicrobium thermophilum DSM 16684 TaxID=1123069 RepID=S9R1Q2_9RHOB|nr:hypothetical protein [Rubellimicrobium thermophilum]EPX87576.1 hypothetical protein ruthe_00440 [Rubellimicrobium thermophilum DSM 16684]
MAWNLWNRFRRDEGGAVTVDWVVLTGGLLIFGVVVASTITAGANATATGAGDRLSSAAVPTISWE